MRVPKQFRPLLLLIVFSAIAGTAATVAQRTPPVITTTAKAIDAAQFLVATLDAAQRSKLLLPLNDQTKIVWSNLPTGAVMQVGATVRNGLRFGDLTPQQQDAALALVAAVLSHTGYQKVLAILNADQRLEDSSAPTRTATARTRFGRVEDYIAILGTPAPSGRWMVQFGGHHLAINVTIVGRDTVLTPTHTGAQPAVYELNGQTIRPLGKENDKAFALLAALDPAQRKQAVLSYQVRNLILGPGEDGKVVQPEGLKASAMNGPQRELLTELVGEWVNILNEPAAAEKMKDVQAHLTDTYFAWAGPTTNGSEVYFRVQGPTVWIEYAPQGPNNTPSIDHIHTIYRDPTNDYARRLTP
jgi:hypothetical protein